MGNLTTLATVRQAVPRLASVVDAEINRLIAEASDVIEKWCNRRFGSGTYTETFDADSSGRLFLPNVPIASITSITTGLPSHPVVVAPSTYAFNASTGEVQGVGGGSYFWTAYNAYFNLYFGDGGPPGFQSVSIVYVGGYTPIPPAIEGWCLTMIDRKATYLKDGQTYASQTWGKVSYTRGNPGMSGLITDVDRRDYSLYRNWQL